VTVGDDAAESRPNALLQNGIYEFPEKPVGYPVEASRQRPGRDGGFPVVHPDEIGISLSPADPVRAHPNGGQDDTPEASGGPAENFSNLDIVRSEGVLFPMPLQGSQGEIGYRTALQSFVKLMGKQLSVIDFHVHAL
jgi:hypothetical protein